MLNFLDTSRRKVLVVLLAAHVSITELSLSTHRQIRIRFGSIHLVSARGGGTEGGRESQEAIIGGDI